MIVYLAARYSRMEELNRCKKDLEAKGHTVSSRWLLGKHQAKDGTMEHWQEFAQEDLDDILSSHMLIAFTEPARTGPTRGGRHVEVGIALGQGIQVTVVGHRENVFYCLPEIEFYETWSEALENLSNRKPPESRNTLVGK